MQTINTVFQPVAQEYEGVIRDAEVHYIWINQDHDLFLSRETRDETLTSVHLHRLDRALDNAQRYPETKFTLWIDYELIDDMSRFWLESYVFDRVGEKLKLKDLRSIPDYKACHLFLPDYENKTIEDSVYFRADAARFCVLSHAARETKQESVVYSDLDCEDVLQCCPDSLDTLERYGMIIGSAEGTTYSHGYLTVKADRKCIIDFLEDVFLDTRTSPVSRHATNYFIFQCLLEKTFGEKVAIEMSVKDLPPLNHKMPYDEYLAEEKICPVDYER